MNIAPGHRDAFSTLVPSAYLNHAAISPPSDPVRMAARTVMDDYAKHGVEAFPRWHEKRDDLRGLLARLINAEPNDIAFVANTTRGITDVALCIPWKAGDRVLLTRGEFPANVTPWQRAAELFDLEVVWLPQPTALSLDAEWFPALKKSLEAGARLVALSAVQFQTGLRMPLDEVGALCAEHGAELCVDAIQACGIVPVDVKADGIHYLSAGSHKWLMGLEGVAMLYVASESAARLRPHVAGWLSHENALSFLFEGPGHLRYDRELKRTPQLFEGGMYNTVGTAALAVSVEMLLKIGVDAVFEHVDAYNTVLDLRLQSLGFASSRASDKERRSGILSVVPPHGVDVTKLHEAIDPTVVSCSIPDGYLRFSPHWPNPKDEVGRVAATVAKAVASL